MAATYDLLKTLAALTALMSPLFWYHFNALSNQRDARKIKKNLDANTTWYDHYLGYLRAALDRIDEIFEPGAFGSASYGACLRISLAYILVSVMLVWGISGNDSPGLEAALPSGRAPVQRFLAVACCAVAALLLIAATRVSNNRRALAMIIAAVLVSVVASAIVGNASFGVVSAVTSAVILSVYFVFRDSKRSTYPITGLYFLYAGSGALCISLILYALKAIGIGPASSVTGALQAFSGIAIVSIGSGCVSYAWAWFERRGQGGLFHVLAWLIFVAVVFATFTSVAAPLIPAGGKVLAVFWILLPLLNTPFDWVSLGVTRRLLRRTTENNGKGALANAVGDILLAFALLIILSISVTAMLCLINLLAQVSGLGRPIAVSGTLKALRYQPLSWDLAWVYVMICSTFIPSVLHLNLASFATSTWALRRAIGRQLAPIINGNGKGSFTEKTAGALLLTLRDVVSHVGPVAVAAAASWSILSIFPAIGDALLWCCEQVALFFGTPVSVETIST